MPRPLGLNRRAPPPTRTNILDRGAVPNDGRDDSEAIQNAIDATSNGAVLIPRGVFQLDQPIEITSGGVVLRGEDDGPNGSVLYVPTNATERNGGVHDMGFSWGSRGFIVNVNGSSSTSTRAITTTAQRGDREITLADAFDFQAGDPIVIRLRDDELYGSLFRHMHNDRLNGWSRGSPSSWCGADGSWVFTVAGVDGSTVRLHEPLPFDLRSAWQPEARRVRAIEEVGVENIRIRFKYSPARSAIKPCASIYTETPPSRTFIPKSCPRRASRAAAINARDHTRARD